MTRRSSAISRCPAAATSWTWRSCRSAGTTRWTASTRSLAAELLGAPQIVPIHYDTFPPIETDAQAFAADVEGTGKASVVVLAPGADLELR